MSANVIFASTAKPMQPPIPQRSRPARLRALPQFSAIVAWIVSSVLQQHGQDVVCVNLESVAPALVDQVSEETLRTLGALDPIAESVARRRARQTAGELLARTLAQATDLELQDAAYLADRGNAIADAVLERYRTQLVYGGATASEARN